MSDVRFLGTTDETTTCDCCGREDLKSTVALSIDGGDAVFYGIDCAARALGRSARDVRKATKAADDAKRRAEDAARAAQHAREIAAWSTFLAATAPAGHCVFTRIQALGGYKAARDLYKASPYFVPERSV